MTEAEDQLSGGVAVITGAGSGIGSGLARRAGQIGMTVIAADLDGAAAQSVAGEIRDAGGEAVAETVDVSRPEELDRLAAETFDRHGSVRLLVNNAGIETLGYSWEVPADRWEKTLGVNLHGVIHGVRAFVPKMLDIGAPCWIANLASIASFGIMPAQTAYMVTKHGVQSFSECLYLELQAIGAPIHVSSVIPSWVKTGIFDAGSGLGENDFATRQRAVMRASMATDGMDLDEASRIIVEGIARGDFWVSTEPDVTREMIEGRIAFLRSAKPPDLTAQTRAILES